MSEPCRKTHAIESARPGDPSTLAVFEFLGASEETRIVSGIIGCRRDSAGEAPQKMLFRLLSLLSSVIEQLLATQISSAQNPRTVSRAGRCPNPRLLQSRTADCGGLLRLPRIRERA